MKDDNKICVLKPGTKVATRSRTGKSFAHVGFVRRATALKDGTVIYVLEDNSGAWLTDVTTTEWEVKPVPPPTWVAEQHEGTWRVRRRSTLRPLIEDRVTFVNKELVQRETWASLRGRAVIAVRDKQAAAEKMAALLNEIEAE